MHPRGEARRRVARRDRRRGEEGEIIALLRATKPSRAIGAGPTPTPRRCAHGWYFTGDTGYFDADGDLFVTGRVDDMIITGGENVSPVEIESCLSLHPAVSEVAVVGLPDERWGKIVAAFIKRTRPVERGRARPHSAALPASPISSGRARYVFVDGHPEIAGRQAVAPQAGRRRVRAGRPKRPTGTHNGNAA